MTLMPAELVFATPRLQVRELGREDLPALQALFDANPGYFLIVDGQPAAPDEAWREFDELPPLPYARRWFAGTFDEAGELQGLLILLSDLCAPGVWHCALFFLADSWHGSGAAAELHDAWEAFARAQGARWLRLGVVAGHARAERFWARCGYRLVRERDMTNAQGEARVVRVLVKPLTEATQDDYLALVPRDVPEISEAGPAAVARAERVSRHPAQ